MPIYSYRCEQCGHAADVLQKMSDAPLTVCPACGEPAFRKQVTAAGFQLKGSGWYVTDFRNPPAGPAKKDAKADAGDAKAEGGSAADAGDRGKSDTKPDAPASAAPESAAPAPAPAKPSTPSTGD